MSSIQSQCQVFSLPKTKSMQANIHISIAVSPSALGEFELMLLKMLTRTRKRVIRSAILVKIYCVNYRFIYTIIFPSRYFFVFWWLCYTINMLTNITCQVQCLEESKTISKRPPRTNLQYNDGDICLLSVLFSPDGK